MESGLITPLALIGTGAAKGVTSGTPVIHVSLYANLFRAVTQRIQLWLLVALLAHSQHA